MGGEAFEYALIRVMPRVQRGELMNAGVILYSQRHGYLGCRIYLDSERLRALDPAADVTAVTAALTAIDEACPARPADRTVGRDAVPLADRHQEHDRPARPGAQRADHGPGGRA